MYVCMYVCSGGQIAQVVEHQTVDPWIAGSSLTSGEKCKNCKLSMNLHSTGQGVLSLPSLRGRYNE